MKKPTISTLKELKKSGYKTESIKDELKRNLTQVLKGGKKTFEISGSVFSDNKPRLVNILGRKMEVNPKGTILLLENEDIPGVIGQIGTLLGDLEVNIAAYLLNRSQNNGKAFAVIRVDNALDDNAFNRLTELDSINWLKQVQLNS